MSAPALPAALHAYLSAPSLQPLWGVLRERLERTGHAVRGTITVQVDDDGADRLAGLLGRAQPAAWPGYGWPTSTSRSGRARPGAGWRLSSPS